MKPIKKLYVNNKVVALDNCTIKEVTELPKYFISVEQDEDCECPLEYNDCFTFYSNMIIYSFTDLSIDELLKEKDYYDKSIREFYQDVVSGKLDDDKYQYKLVYAYVHGGVTLSLSKFNDQFDSGVGYVARIDKTQKRDDISVEDWLNNFILLTNRWLSGCVYSFTITDELGEVVDACGGFLDLNVTSTAENMYDYISDEYGITLNQIIEKLQDLE